MSEPTDEQVDAMIRAGMRIERQRTALNTARTALSRCEGALMAIVEAFPSVTTAKDILEDVRKAVAEIDGALR